MKNSIWKKGLTLAIAAMVLTTSGSLSRQTLLLQLR